MAEKRLCLLVRLSRHELHAIERGAQVVTNAADCADLDVGREYDMLTSRLYRLAQRVRKNNRRTLIQQVAPSKETR